MAGRLDLTTGLLAKILRTSEPSVARMKIGAEVLPVGSKSSVRGELFVQMFHNLDAAMNHVDDASRAWLNTPCLELDGRPITVIQTGEGLMKAVALLSSKKRKPPLPGAD
ncbi:MAG: antitoxin Xre/MbcA/ParS toxin-binding domain-containing protein [Rhodospirillaceae bacterium]